ncbi:MAG: class I SAM-dependent DNA methyltransferase [Akkermansia sp.]|nr:class I SAM-dependent DNA methyltransferase [Akkermansia sp.]
MARTQEQIETILKTLSPNPELIYDVLIAYGFPKATVTRIKSGDYNQSKEPGQIIWKKQLCYQEVLPGTSLSALQDMRSSKAIMKHRPRFLVVSDGNNWSALDTKDEETREFPIADLYKHCDFFLPWTGREKAKFYEEKTADINAARKMGKLFDAIKADNPGFDEHALNVFMARLLFCFFAEDSGILPEDQMFTDLLEETTLEDGSDMAEVFARVFHIMNMPEDAPARKDLPVRYTVFPYVNGGLFAHDVPVPVFSRKSRDAVLVAGHQDWSEINTDIFGNMFQACQDPAKREELGEHYTSVPNIMKVLNPLFLDELREEAEKVKGNEKAAARFIQRISTMRFFDPACGSGNFLLIAYKELRELEMDVIAETPGLMCLPSVNIQQFYGVEIDDFAHEVAVLSMWLVDHQMNERFMVKLGKAIPTLPLKPNDKIIHGNALRLDWEKVCPKPLDTSAPLYTLEPLLMDAAPVEQAEIYIFGNPPFGGKNRQTKAQKADLAHVFRRTKNKGCLDYSLCWFRKAYDYMYGTSIKCALVSTNSITQGEQVGVFWGEIENSVSIDFAYTSFKWENNARQQAGVTCVIIGFSCAGRLGKRMLFTSGLCQSVDYISPYLRQEKVIIGRRSTALSSILPYITFGNMAYGKSLILQPEEYTRIIGSNKNLSMFFRKLVGSKEFISCTYRYCLWLPNFSLVEIEQYAPIYERVIKCRDERLEAKDKGGVKLAQTPHLFRETNEGEAIIVPRVSSFRRTYIPVGYVDADTIVSDSAFAIYGAEPWVLAVLSSSMHMTWVRISCGRLKNDYRYSADLCYHTFPLRMVRDEEKELLNESAYNILDIREKHTEMTLGDMYNPESMPADLKQAHEENDRLVDSLYRKKPFFSEEERLECLFALYQQMIEEKK